MAQHSGFFNALLVDGIPDRRYNANAYSDNLACVISNGVLRSENDDLKVTANGMTVTVAAGRAWIKGHYFYNDSPVSFTVPAAPAAGSRYDRIMLRLDTDISKRSISIVYTQGEAAASPERPFPVREGSIYELSLCDIIVEAGQTSVGVVDTRANAGVCGWVYSTAGDSSFLKSLDNAFYEWFDEKKDTLSSVTLFNRYDWRTVMQSASKAVSFSIPQYDADTCLLEVFVNGVLDVQNVDYSLNGSVITFTDNLVSGTEIVVRVYKSIDGTGILSIADEITELQNKVAALEAGDENTYICNGIDDNVKLSQIAQTFLNGDDDRKRKTIRVFGNFGATSAFSGSGTAAIPYRWMSLGIETETSRRITFDFSNCSQLSFPVKNETKNNIFTGNNVHIVGATVAATSLGVNSTIRVFSSVSGEVIAENCTFIINAAKSSVIGNSGTFTNCKGKVVNMYDHSYCFTPQTGSILRVIGGEYMAYTSAGQTDPRSAIVWQNRPNSVSILTGVNAPVLDEPSMTQTHALYQTAGGGNLNCRDMITTLQISVFSGSSEVTGTIPQNIPTT